MREILFRGKQEYKSRQWVFGSLHSEYGETDRNGERKIDHRILGMRGECDYVVPETVGQFTGLTDKNGKKIFEGDIVKFTDSPFGYSYIGSVCFHEGSFCIQYTYWNKDAFHRIGQTDKWQDMGASGTVTYEYEIIGNIHDNPELLEVSDG